MTRRHRDTGGMPCTPEHRERIAPEHVVDPVQALERTERFRDEMALRRTVRRFDPGRPVPPGVVEAAIEAAATAPSGANVQPWRFVVVTDPQRKALIREGAEAEERAFYEADHPEWHRALAPLGTDADKAMLTDAPVVIVVFEVHAGGEDPKPYYVKESVGIAVGILLTALHRAGLATLTHTPSPMRFLNRILERPRHERPFCLVVTGYPAPGATVPDIDRKPPGEVIVWR
jgi:iodotyrosine deiodinase